MTSSWAIVFFALSFHLLSLVYIYTLEQRGCAVVGPSSEAVQWWGRAARLCSGGVEQRGCAVVVAEQRGCAVVGSRSEAVQWWGRAARLCSGGAEQRGCAVAGAEQRGCSVVGLWATKASYTPGLGEQSEVQKDSMIKVHIWYRNMMIY